MRSSFTLAPFLLFAAPFVSAAVLPRLDLPKDSPVAVLSSDPAGSSEISRGGAVVVDLHDALTLRNAGERRIRGITLMVVAQDISPGGKASVTVPSLNVAPGDTFPIRVDLRLLRPVQAAEGFIQITLDGVLFDDLSFYGPDRLSSRRALTVYELEARRDRRYFRSLLDDKGPQGLQQEMLSAMSRSSERSGISVQMVRGPATNFDAERQVRFSFLEFPDAPVQTSAGVVRVAANEARGPRLSIRNRSEQQIRSVELGWIVRDQQGREFLADSLPADLNLGPGQSREIVQDATLRFPQRAGEPVAVAGMSGFVRNVEFADRRVWIPSRSALNDPRLEKVLAPSPEEDRLIQVYRKKGLKGLIEELKRF
jgi:hypothetical protein